MKSILFFLGLICFIEAKAQDPVYVQMKSNYQYKGIKMDSLFVLPNLDTANAREVTGAIVRMGSTYYWYNGTAWVPVTGGGGSTDTTSLSNRINDKIDSLRRVGTQVSFKKNGTWFNAYTDSVGSGFVPYTGAIQDVDLGNNGLDAKFLKITGTDGAGHIDLKHQSSNATAQGNSTSLFANSNGYLKWKNDNLHYSTLATPQTADRVYTFENKSYTLADSADVALKLNASDSSIYQTKYRSDTMRVNIYGTLNGKLNTSDTASMLTNYQRTSSFPIATFGAGSGVAGDTASFSTSSIYGSFYNDGMDTIVLTGYRGIVQGTSASITPTIYFNDTLSMGAATKIVNSPSAVSSTTIGNSVTSLDNTKIPPGNWVWVQSGTVTTKPTYFSLTLFGYRKR